MSPRPGLHQTKDSQTHGYDSPNRSSELASVDKTSSYESSIHALHSSFEILEKRLQELGVCLSPVRRELGKGSCGDFKESNEKSFKSPLCTTVDALTVRVDQANMYVADVLESLDI